jgi:anti-anti-sigma regulatory factor
MARKAAAITLQGEWTLENAADIRTVLAAKLASLQEVEERPDSVELQMAEMTGIDACGCQLLAIFLGNLRRDGITPLPCEMTEQVRERIAVLGFSTLL